MEVRPSRCSAADAQLSNILYNVNKLQVTTDCVSDRNKCLMKSWKVMDAIDDKVKEAAA